MRHRIGAGCRVESDRTASRLPAWPVGIVFFRLRGAGEGLGMRVCAVIPAAGRGSRLGIGGPKILASVSESETIWSVLHAKLAPLVDHVHLVLSPDGAAAFPPLPPNVSHSIQPEPLGMGDPIFGARPAC